MKNQYDPREYNKRLYDKQMHDLNENIKSTNNTMTNLQIKLEHFSTTIEQITETLKEHDLIFKGNDKVSGHIKDITVLKNTVKIITWVFSFLVSIIGMIVSFFKFSKGN